jgi:putative transposase
VVKYQSWMTTARDSIYAGYRHPAEIISYVVWLYFRFPLSLRMVEEMLAARGISVTYETIRQGGLKFGRAFARRIRRRAPCRGDKWHLDEVVITIAGTKHWLWRAVDQEGFVLDVLVQSRRDKKAAKRLLRKLLKKQGRPPRVLITDKLRSHAAAKREIMPGVEHRQHKGLMWTAPGWQGFFSAVLPQLSIVVPTWELSLGVDERSGQVRPYVQKPGLDFSVIVRWSRNAAAG